MRARRARQLRNVRDAAAVVVGSRVPVRVRGSTRTRAFRALSWTRASGVPELRERHSTGGRPLRVAAVRVHGPQLRRAVGRVVFGRVPGTGDVPDRVGYDGPEADTGGRDRGRGAGPRGRRTRAVPAATGSRAARVHV